MLCKIYSLIVQKYMYNSLKSCIRQIRDMDLLPGFSTDYLFSFFPCHFLLLYHKYKRTGDLDLTTKGLERLYRGNIIYKQTFQLKYTIYTEKKDTYNVNSMNYHKVNTVLYHSIHIKEQNIAGSRKHISCSLLVATPTRIITILISNSVAQCRLCLNFIQTISFFFSPHHVCNFRVVCICSSFIFIAIPCSI